MMSLTLSTRLVVCVRRLAVATLVAVVLYPHVAVTVLSGHVGVLWKRFGGGTVLDPRRLRDIGFVRLSRLAHDVPWVKA